jgi:hypothetical protein
MVERMIEAAFPQLRGTAWSITSPKSESYNCIAWAAGDDANWWWPDPADPRAIWPTGARIGQGVADFVSAFATLGYEVTSEEEAEPGIDRVALFAAADGTVAHAARQLSSGAWTSKLGRGEDIEHLLHSLEGTAYGKVVQVLRRAATSQ